MRIPLTSARVEVRRSTRVICRKSLVSGRVQGVFYRATTAHRARELGIRGYAHNLADGRVEVLACGEAQVVEEFVKWLWTGSTGSKVTAVAVEEIDPKSIQLPAGFRTG
jgi:acylphosphatase